VPPNSTGPDYVAACRAPDARYALIYFPSGKPATIRTFLLKAPKLAAQWFDPRTGERRDGPTIAIAPWKTTEFTPPAADQDWVLVLETATVEKPQGAAESADRWRERTADWQAKTNFSLGDWGLDRPGYPAGLYLHGITRPEGQNLPPQ
jgi:hypothetical protein